VTTLFDVSQIAARDRHIRTVHNSVPADEKDFPTYLKCCIK